MRDSHVGDTSDFIKYGFLTRLCEPHPGEPGQIKLGVVWYYNPDASKKPRGKTVDRALGRRISPSLYSELLAVRVKETGLYGIERAGIFTGAVFYRAPMIFPKSGRSNKAREARAAAWDKWLDGALNMTKGCELVFLDPDTGLGDASNVSPTSGRATAYAFLNDVGRFLERHQSVIVYHYLGRRTSADTQIGTALLKACLDLLWVPHQAPSTPLRLEIPFAVRHRRGRGPKAFLIFPAGSWAGTWLRRRVWWVLSSAWGECLMPVELPWATDGQ